VRALGIDGSPGGYGKTAQVIEAVLKGLPPDWQQDVVHAAGDQDGALASIELGNAFVFGAPMYRATYAAPLKVLLDRLPRGMWGETSAPITGRAVVIVGTGASWHHFLGLDPLRDVLAGFFAAHVLPPGLYVPAEGFDAEGRLRDSFAELAALQGAALAELALTLSAGGPLAALRPQA